MPRPALTFSLVCASLLVPALSYAGTITTTSTVASTAVVYAAGTQSALAPSAGGTLPTAIAVASGSSYFTFSVPSINGTAQTITLNSGGNYNTADGTNSAVGTSSNSGYGSISGIYAPGAGYLTGVFVAAGGPSGAAPALLDFTGTNGTAFTSLTPQLDQVFFIGDGLTGTGTGSVQTFYVPTGAATLYLGISDAGGYNGSPGSYGDNSGNFSVIANDVTTGTTPVSVTPEPSSLVLLGTGLLGVAGAVKRRLA